MFSQVRSLLAALTLVAGSACPAVILDQHNDDLSQHFFNSESSTISIQQAQTFTVGLTGTLVELQVWMTGTPINAPALAIRRTVNARPSDSASDVLSAQTVLTSEVSPYPNFGFAVFKLDVPVVANEQLAFVFYQPNGPVGQNFALADTASFPSDLYPGGGLWTSGNPPYGGGSWYPNGNTGANLDVIFRTYVDVPTPEPGTWSLLIVGISLSLLFWVADRLETTFSRLCIGSLHKAGLLPSATLDS